MKLSFTESLDLQSKVRASLDYLSTHTVQVGIPPESDQHAGPFSASQLLALQERGSPVNHMPPRPVLQPALQSEDTRSDMAAAMTDAADAAHRGDLSAVKAALEKSGEAGVRGIRRYILSGKLPANAPLTVHGGWIRNRVSHKPVYVKGKGFNKPLIETGELLNAFGYVIKPK